MRLVTLLLTAAALTAQEPRRLPWDRAASLPWRASLESLPEAVPPGQPSSGTLRVILEPGGALKVVDGRGLVRFRTGLPGRPRLLWRDGGLPLQGTSGTWSFPEQTPLRQGIGALPLGQADFRPGLEGLLWILDDEERLLTLLHPATGRLAYLPLPTTDGVEVRFLPDALAVRQLQIDSPRARACWTLPWLSLLPQFIQLGTPRKAEKPGTALNPFPGE